MMLDGLISVLASKSGSHETELPVFEVEVFVPGEINAIELFGAKWSLFSPI